MDRDVGPGVIDDGIISYWIRDVPPCFELWMYDRGKGMFCHGRGLGG